VDAASRWDSRSAPSRRLAGCWGLGAGG
jgi:hypothetical protein